MNRPVIFPHAVIFGRSHRISTKAEIAKERSCRECGCTDNRACPGGCYWVEADLCSACAPVRAETQQ